MNKRNTVLWLIVGAILALLLVWTASRACAQMCVEGETKTDQFGQTLKCVNRGGATIWAVLTSEVQPTPEHFHATLIPPSPTSTPKPQPELWPLQDMFPAEEGVLIESREDYRVPASNRRYEEIRKPLFSELLGKRSSTCRWAYVGYDFVSDGCNCYYQCVSRTTDAVVDSCTKAGTVKLALLTRAEICKCKLRTPDSCK